MTIRTSNLGSCPGTIGQTNIPVQRARARAYTSKGMAPSKPLSGALPAVGAATQSVSDDYLAIQDLFEPAVIETRSVNVKLPVAAGKTFVHTVDGVDREFVAPDGSKKGDKVDMAFTVQVAVARIATEKMFFCLDTMPGPPVGMRIVKQFPAIYAFSEFPLETLNHVQIALEEAASVGANAIVGAHVTLTMTSTGRLVEVSGTPCYLHPESDDVSLSADENPGSAATQIVGDDQIPDDLWVTVPPETRFVNVKLPVAAGKTFVHTVDGVDREFVAPDGSKKGDKVDMAFTVQVAVARIATEKMFFCLDTMPGPPVGMRIVKQFAPMSTVTSDITEGSSGKYYVDGKTKTLNEVMQSQMQEAQADAFRTAAAMGANALLGVKMAFSSKPALEGNNSVAMAFEHRWVLQATPCYVLPAKSADGSDVTVSPVVGDPIYVTEGGAKKGPRQKGLGITTDGVAGAFNVVAGLFA